MSGALELLVRLDRTAANRTSGVAVRIESLTESAKVQPWTVLVPTGPRGLIVDVEPGRYQMQAWLPSGQILRRSATVTPGETSLVEFLVKKSGIDDIRERSSLARPVDLHKEYDPNEFQPAFSSLEDADKVEHAHLEIFGERASGDSWSELSDFDEKPENFEYQSLSDHVFDSIVSTDKTITLLIEAHDWSRTAFDLARRHWIKIDNDHGSSLGILPTPWLSGSRDANSSIEVNYERLHRRLEISIHDKTLDLLLAYLKSGRISAAELTIDALPEDGILETIRDKRSNPLAACAAAYVSLATANRNQIDVWRKWSENLMDWFPYIPDGAIVRARTLMDGPVTLESRDEILRSAKVAFRRGVPFFTVGVQHLRETLALFGSEDAEATNMLKYVRSISSRCDISEAFTTLQYPDQLARAHVPPYNAAG